MIVLDTYVWVFWVHGDRRLSASNQQLIADHETSGLGISAISCWEICKLVERGRLTLPCELPDWFRQALAYPGVTPLLLTPEVAIESTQLPGSYPADQMIVATARVQERQLIINDQQLRDYPHVSTP